MKQEARGKEGWVERGGVVKKERGRGR